MGTLYSAAKRAGLTSPEHSLRFAFSLEEEEALVVVCLLHARQGTPLTRLEFRQLAAIYAKRDGGKIFSSHFVSNFVSRHSDELCAVRGKITSPTRCHGVTKQRTEDFIASMDIIMRKKIINQNNMVAFDETVIGDSVSIPIVIGERKDSGGGTVNVCKIREVALGTYIPFSLPDGSTPLRVFILRTGKVKKGEEITASLAPNWEKGLRGDPHRLFLKSETGYLTNELFKYIMEQFANWWNSTRPGLHCFLICDNLSIHKNECIVKDARSRGIHMINIMPGTSRWFQVHDQLPFGILKKMMAELKNQTMPLSSLEPKDRMVVRFGHFYEAEKLAFEPRVVVKSYADVGVWPWDPQKIRKACEKHCPAGSHPDRDRAFHAVAESVKTLNEKRVSDCCETVRSLKPVSIVSLKPPQKRKRPGNDAAKNREEEKETHSTSSAKKTKGNPTQPPSKRLRKGIDKLKKCCVRGCRETHFWSKKCFFCSSCEKHFCPRHADKFHNHHC